MFTLTGIALLVTMVLALIRAIKGPTVYDRILASNALGTKTVLMIVVLGFIVGEPDLYIDIALMYALIGFIGTVLGAAIGIVTAINLETLIPMLENLFQVEFFPSSIYVITDFPAQMRWSDVARIMGASFSLSVLATLYPAWRASRMQPVEALRYE